MAAELPPLLAFGETNILADVSKRSLEPKSIVGRMADDGAVLAAAPVKDDVAIASLPLSKVAATAVASAVTVAAARPPSIRVSGVAAILERSRFAGFGSKNLTLFDFYYSHSLVVCERFVFMCMERVGFLIGVVYFIAFFYGAE